MLLKLRYCVLFALLFTFQIHSEELNTLEKLAGVVEKDIQTAFSEPQMKARIDDQGNLYIEHFSNVTRRSNALANYIVRYPQIQRFFFTEACNPAPSCTLLSAAELFPPIISNPFEVYSFLYGDHIHSSILQLFDEFLYRLPVASVPNLPL